MDVGREDGELSSDNEGEEFNCPPAPQNSGEVFDDILDDNNYVIIDRPKSSLPVAEHVPATKPISVPAPPCSSTQPPVSKIQIPGPVYDGYGRKDYFNKIGLEDLRCGSSDKDTSSESDSDDDDFHGKRSRMTMPLDQQLTGVFPGWNRGNSLDSIENDQSTGLQDFAMQAEQFQKQRKPNLVWANVMQEEEISKGLGFSVRVGGDEGEIRVTRGPETYFYERPKPQPRQRRESDSSDISSGGLSDHTFYSLNGDPADADEETGQSDGHSLPKSFTSGAEKKAVSKRRRNSKKYKRKVISKLNKMKSSELARYMSTKLEEKKIPLVQRAVELLGKEKVIHVFLKTLKIEKRGGIMVKSHSRRRTPGGVFFYLIRGDPRFPKSLIDNLFKEDKFQFEKGRKKRVATKRLRNKVELEKSLAVKDEKMKTDDLSESQSDYTAVPDREGSDTGQYGDDSAQDSSVNSRDTAAEELVGFVGMDCGDGSES